MTDEAMPYVANENSEHPAGWFADPGGSGSLRWWDGNGWTDHLHSEEELKALAKQDRRVQRSEKRAATMIRLQEQVDERKTAQLMANFKGLRLTGDRISYGADGGPIAGAHATVETAGDVYRRITATRLVLTGPLALAWRKKKDHRELYLVVEGIGFAFTVPVGPKNGLEARQLASKINGLSSVRREPTSDRPQIIEVGPPTTAEELERLGALHRSGTLTDAEFSAAKAKLLGL